MNGWYPLNPANIAARKANLYNKRSKNKNQNDAKRILHKIMIELRTLFDFDGESQSNNTLSETYLEKCNVH